MEPIENISRGSLRVPIGLGSLEAQLMELLWHSGEPLRGQEILKNLQGQHNYKTVMTVLNRLVEKNYTFEIYKISSMAIYFSYFSGSGNHPTFARAYLPLTSSCSEVPPLIPKQPINSFPLKIGVEPPEATILPFVIIAELIII